MKIHWDLFKGLLGAAALIALLRKIETAWVVLAGIVVSLVWS